MLGLIYPLLGKGKTGDAQMKFFKDNLFNPFSKAMDSLAAARVQLMADFKALKENLDVPKTYRKKLLMALLMSKLYVCTYGIHKVWKYQVSLKEI